MDDDLEKPKVQADHNSIAIGEINISGSVTGNITIGRTIAQPVDARLRRDLGILLKNVETTWIKGVLEKSVHEAALLELGMELREETVDNPWRMVMEKPDQSQEVIPQGRKIKDIFDEANHLLLILGEPGSGKTTTLLQLARDLIAEVDEAFTQPIPVILNLSTWTDKQQPLDGWLVAEMNSKYRLPKKDGKKWLQDGRILPLLDGLDEVRAENRAACVEKINQLATEYGLQGMVVCSRIKDYTDLNVRLAFYRAIYIQPLTPKQVDEYLNQAGDNLASLRAILQSDEALRSMAQSPLILNIMSLAYQNTSAEALRDPTLVTNEARRKLLFDTYIARMFNRKTKRQEYDNEQTKQQLSWLARNLQKHNQEVFLIEGLQPSWLSTWYQQCLYVIFSRIIIALGLAISFLRGIWPYSIYGVIVGFSISIIDIFRFRQRNISINRKEYSTTRRSVISFISVWITTCCVFSLYILWRQWSYAEESDGPIAKLVHQMLIVSTFGPFFGKLVQGILVASIFGSLFGLIAGVIFGPRVSRQNIENDILTVEALHWSWQNAIVGIPLGGIVGLLFGLIVGSYIAIDSGLRVALSCLPISGISFGMLGLILNGLRPKILEAKSIPNQGIWLSLRNALTVGLGFTSFALIIGTVAGWLAGITEGDTNELDFLPRLALSFGILSALWYGGFDVIQHYILRLILVIQEHTPRNYAHFLDYSVDRIFLQKVGGGYRFIHRLLLEHFVEMYPTTKKV